MGKTRLDHVKEERNKKIGKLESLGLSAYPQVSLSKQTTGYANKKDGIEVVLAGRLLSWRGHGKIQFADLADQDGKIQLAFKADNLSGDEFERLSLLDTGDIIEVSGETFTTKAGERTVEVKSYQLLSKAVRPLPSVWHGLKDTEERYRQRYVDLILNKGVREVFYIRSKLITKIREFFDQRGFLEVETPILQPVYGGATARPFITHHNSLGKDFYLRIADELYLKRLIVGGFEKVYEIGHDFRNEGMSRAHNPEFTQIEFYWAYATYNDLMGLTEELFEFLLKKVNGSLRVEHQGKTYDFTRPWKRLTYQEAIAQYAKLDITSVKNEELLLREIKERKIDLNLKGVVGYAATLDALYKKLVRPHLSGPLFLTDYPYEMKPLAKRKIDDPSLTGNFQLLVGGEELINAYDELNDPADQRARWEEEAELAKEGLDEHQVIDEDYIRALEYGMPPTAGWGLGIDRLTMFLTNQSSIKDVILFPTLKPEFDQPKVKKGKKNG
jgi:lysyl-tRNA synthetase class 2